MFGIPYVRQDWIDQEVAQTVTWDLRGHRFHIVFGLMWCLLIAGPVSFVEWAGVGLVITSFARAYYIHRTWRSFGCHPQLWAIALWALWQGISIRWSPDTHQGWHELSTSRWTWSMWFLWSILPRRPWIITAIAISFLFANLGQVAQGLAVHYHVESLQFPRYQDRNAAWWQPVVGGSMLCAALGLHLPAAAMGSGRQRWLGLAGCAVTLIGIVATGTRGAWIGAGLLIAIVLIVALVRWARSVRGSTGKRVGLLLGAVVLTLLLTWFTAGDSITRRYHLAHDEITRAIQQHDYASNTGARILMWQLAIQEIQTHPFRGVGAGGFRAWAIEEMHRRGQTKYDLFILNHAHSTYLHIAATTGLIGLSLWTLVITMAIRGGFKGMQNRLGTYAAGPAFAIIGLLCAGLFDVIQLNAQTAALLAVLMSLTIWPRPTEWPAEGPPATSSKHD